MAKREPWYSRTEAKLYNFPNVKEAIAHIKAQVDLLNDNMAPPRATTYRDGPPTTADRMTEPEAFANMRGERRDRLLKKIALKEAEKAAIEAALKRLSGDELDLVTKWYFEDWRLKRPDMKIWRALSICESDFYKHKNNVVYKIANFLGEDVPEENPVKTRERKNSANAP